MKRGILDNYEFKKPCLTDIKRDKSVSPWTLAYVDNVLKRGTYNWTPDKYITCQNMSDDDLLICEGGLNYGPRSFIMPLQRCFVDNMSHCAPNSSTLAYLKDSSKIEELLKQETDEYLIGMKGLGGSGRKPLLQSQEKSHMISKG